MQNIYSFSRAHGCLPVKTMFWAIKQVSIHAKKFEIFCFLTKIVIFRNEKQLIRMMKIPNIWKLKNTFLKRLWVKEKITE